MGLLLGPLISSAEPDVYEGNFLDDFGSKGEKFNSFS